MAKTKQNNDQSLLQLEFDFMNDALLAEMVDASDLKSAALVRAGSNPAEGTNNR